MQFLHVHWNNEYLISHTYFQHLFLAPLPDTLLPDGMTMEILHESVLIAVTDRDMRSVAHEDDRALDFLDLMHIDHI